LTHFGWSDGVASASLCDKLNDLGMDSTVPKPAVIKGWEQLHFHYFPEGQLSRLRAKWGELKICTEQPKLADIACCVTSPVAYRGKRVAGVYDANNSLIPCSARFRGKDRRVDGVLNCDDLVDAVEDRRDAYYLGRGECHYGHFILEVLSRAWAWREHGRDRVPVLQLAIPPFALALCGLIPGLAERLDIIRTPTRFRNMLVPAPGFVIAREAYIEFKRMCEQMAEQANVCSGPVTEQPLYLSRAGLNWNRRTIEGEVFLEHALEKEGFIIVRPETLPVAEQIALVNRHRWIVSPEGSACHTRLFSRIPTHFVTITSSYLNPNYILCDLLCEGTSHYLNALVTPQIGTKTRLGKFLEPVALDRARILGALNQLGLVRSSAVSDAPPPDLNEYKLRWIEAARSRIKRKPDDEKKIFEGIDEVNASLNETE